MESPLLPPPLEKKWEHYWKNYIFYLIFEFGSRKKSFKILEYPLQMVLWISHYMILANIFHKTQQNEMV